MNRLRDAGPRARPAVVALLAGVALWLPGAASGATSLPPFATATQERLPNGVILADQPSGDLPLVGAQIFLPAGLAQQPSGKAGVAAIAAQVVLQTPVEGSATLADVVRQVGGSITYTLDPLDTRFYLECRVGDFPRLVHDLRSALGHPDLSRVAAVRETTLTQATNAAQNPLEATYLMVRQVNYSGTGFAFPDEGDPLTVARIVPSDVAAFAASYQHANGTIVAVVGLVTPAALDAVRRDFGTFTPEPVAPPPSPAAIARLHQVVAHRQVPAPWVAIAYQAPDQYSADFAAMLVIEALLGSGGDIHAFTFTSDTPLPDDYVGAYYQYEAQPGSMIVFMGGESANLDQSVRDLETGIARLRGENLSPQLIEEGKKLALGAYYLSANTLRDQAWLLGRSAASPQGVAFENLVPQRILAVSAADIQRVARRYLTRETIAIVLPRQESQ
jgi:zinc protease